MPGIAHQRLPNTILAFVLIPTLACIAFCINSNLRTFAAHSLSTATGLLPASLRAFSSSFPSSFPSSVDTNMTRAPVIALSHGGGPMPLLNDSMHKEMIYSMSNRVPKILKLNTPEAPRAIVLVTAHWSENRPTISSGSKPKLLFDYYGFPKETYEYKYDAPGSPEVAAEVEKAFSEEGLKPETDAFRGWDHGVFVPMLLVNPKANIPVVQVSVLENESPEQHFEMGRALAKLRDRNIAIVGSGFASMHNLPAMRSGSMSTPAFLGKNKQWSNELSEAIEQESVETREKKMADWRKFTGAYDMHPRDHAEHFMPLLVCLAAGGNGKAKKYADDFNGLKVWSYYWE